MKTSIDKSLRTSLITLAIIAMLVTLGMAGSLILSIRLPNIAKANQAAAAYQARELATRVDILLDGLEMRVHMISRIMAGTSRLSATVLDNFANSDNGLEALYVINPEGNISFTGISPNKQALRPNIFSVDFASNPLHQAALNSGKATWLDSYTSALTGDITTAVAIPFGRQVVIAEIPIDYILKATQLSAGDPNLSTWLLNKRGEVIVDTEGHLQESQKALMNLPLVKSAIKNEQLPATFTYRGKHYYPAKVSLSRMDWVFLTKMPAGLDNQTIRSTLIDMGALFVASIIVVLLLALWWAGHMIRPVQALIGQAHDVAKGHAPAHWPRGNIAEFNQLSSDLEVMADTLQERELKFLAIFNETPVAIVASDQQDAHAITEVNDVWIQQFGYTREEVIGKSGVELGLWFPEAEATSSQESALPINRIEACLHRKDGQELICLISSRVINQTDRPLLITVMEDVTERRRMERELRNLTIELEQRVVQRTQALALANDELTQTLHNLRLAQAELVQAEKLAALGRLVAGVAHELNTPIGNGLMAASTLRDESLEFEQQVKQGIHRSDLATFIHDVVLAAEITSRNLERAAHLITSFKQVSVDQTSSKRREFNLKLVVDEILLTLRPMFKHTPYQVEADVPDDMNIDSYPGPLEQILTNLISNALQHGFEGRDYGTVLIKADQPEDGWICIHVTDDGCGIPQELQSKIFVPFFTTRMGRGGVGLGLHIAHNLVTHVLGGSISLKSTVEQGTTFTLRIPQKAPELPKLDPL